MRCRVLQEILAGIGAVALLTVCVLVAIFVSAVVLIVALLR
jgi:hypothetical protein